MSFLGDLGGALLGFAYEQRVALMVAALVGVALLAVLAWRGGWASRLRRHPVLAAGAAIIVLAVGLPLAWYLVSPVFIRTELVEAPVAVVAETPPVSAAPPTTAVPSGSSPTASAAPTPETTATPAAWTPAPPRTGSFKGTDDFHFGRGTATLIETAPGAWSIRFEDFSVRNGPDLFVYLSPDANDYTNGALEVARLKATDGSFNQALPAGTDPAAHRSILIWCKQFSHLFAVATLDG